MTTAIPDSIRADAARVSCPHCGGKVEEIFLDPTDGAWQLNITHFDDCTALADEGVLVEAGNIAARAAGFRPKEETK